MATTKYSALFVGVLLVAACGRGNLASEIAQAPEFNPEGQTKCKVQASQAKPLIVEWPSADRAELEAKAKSHVVVVRYDGCEMQVLGQCKAPVGYSYTSVTPKEDTISIRNEDELWASIPMGAAKFESKLAATGQLNVAMTMVGRFEAERPQLRRDELSGVCDGATHVLSGLTVGAFEFYSGADAEISAGVSVVGVGAEGGSKSSKETLAKDGDPKTCRQEGDFTKVPPRGCAALLRVEALPLLASRRASQPVPPQRAVAPPPSPTRVPDTDGDGINDASDQCRDQPEDIDDFEDDDGCPEDGGSWPPVKLGESALQFSGPIHFKTGKATIDLHQSGILLREVAKLLNRNPGLRIDVGVHTDDRGGADQNLKLSQARAASVKVHLVKEGVAASRLVATGYGEKKPIASNKTRAGREQNRRVEFLIIRP
jgi:outer membrane protein OmpA-like peptidoglycan-associated protein